MTNSIASPPAASLEHFAAQTPDASAIVEAGEALTYREWNNRANRLANALAAAGIKAGDAVGVRSQIRTEWFIVNQALAKLGASQVAVNWRLTPPEARYIMEDSRACAIVYDDEDPSALANGWTSLELKLVMTMQPARAHGVVRYADFLAAGSPEPRITAAGRS